MGYAEEVVMYFFIFLGAIYIIRFLFFQSLFQNMFGTSGGSMAKRLGEARKALKFMDVFN